MNKNGSIGIAVVGCGRIAGHHIAAIRETPQIDLIALCDLDLPQAGARDTDAEVPHYRTYEEMLSAEPEIDAVVLATPSGLHAIQAMRIMRNWNKHIIVEKPPALGLASFEAMVAIAKDCDLQIFPVFQYRFNAAVQRCCSAIERGEFGDLHIVSVRQRWCRSQRYYDQALWRGTYSLDGGALTNQGIHHLDLIQYLGGPVARVSAATSTFGSSIEVEDTAVATMSFENGALGSLEISTAVRPDDVESSVSLIGSKGYAVIGGWATDKLQMFSPLPTDTNRYSQSHTDAYGFGHRNIYSGVRQVLLESGDPAVTVSEARQALKLLHALYVSADSTQSIDVEFTPEYSPLGAEARELWAAYGEAPLTDEERSWWRLD